jgi:acyl carrier protein
MSDTNGSIRTFFSGFFRTAELKDSDDIFALGLVNSLFAMQLILWLEKEMSITVTDEDLDIRNFNSIDSIAALVARKSLAAAEV